MTKHKIYFRADASASIGYGHFVRTLALADMLKDDFECTFFTTSPTAYQIREMESVCHYVALEENTKFEQFLKYLTGDEIVVLDNYFYSTCYQREIKAKGCKLVCVDDVHDKHYVADVVINHALTDRSLFDVEPYTRLCLGFEWALLRKPFLQAADKEKTKDHWLVSFGGSDYKNMTGRFMSILQNDVRVKSVTVIVGDAYQYMDTLSQYSKAIVKKNLSAAQMAEEMVKAEYAVLPSSTVSIEAVSRKCKIASGYFVDNQKYIAKIWADEGFVVGLGDLDNYNSNQFISDLLTFQPNQSIDFSGIPSRYQKLFKEI